jgi:hypothetical protein
VWISEEFFIRNGQIDLVTITNHIFLLTSSACIMSLYSWHCYCCISIIVHLLRIATNTSTAATIATATSTAATAATTTLWIKTCHRPMHDCQGLTTATTTRRQQVRVPFSSCCRHVPHFWRSESNDHRRLLLLLLVATLNNCHPSSERETCAETSAIERTAKKTRRDNDYSVCRGFFGDTTLYVN